MRKKGRDTDKDEVARITRALKTIVQLRGVPHRFIEQQMGAEHRLFEPDLLR